MQSGTISVIIPVYNTEKYLERCLQSILRQTYGNMEVICVNDGSTDNSAAILARYAFEDERIKVLTQENKGQSAARNAALKIAGGDYVFFVDSDDFIHPQTFEILLNALQKSGAPVAATVEAKNYDKTLVNVEFSTFEVHKNPLLHILRNEASGSVIWNKLYKREIVQNRPFIEGIYFEDWCWITCLFADIETYATVPFALYGYNTENTSTMRSTFTLRKIDNYATGIRAVREYFEQPRLQNLWPTVRKIRIGASLRHLINAVYHNKKERSELDKCLFATLKALHEEQCFYYRELRFKVLMRLAKIWFRNRGK
ncbi:MAG: glycosyltransferase family 2 protein [Alphaproteobacteria bacterium]|nr:glycosyltransferase family 2 protein [Alphaproteobacteria bacterium]